LPILQDNIPPYWIWGHYIAFHTYQFQWFMWAEFDGATFDSEIFPTGEDVLKVQFDFLSLPIQAV
jgi:hypothetical protein